jgi:hypothetical protein
MDPKHRLTSIVRQALDGATFVASRAEEGGQHLVIEARRPDGRLASVRFRAVSDAEASAGTAVGVPLTLRSVDSGPSGCLPLGWFIPALRGIPRGVSRVRIDAGGAKLDIVCQDAEWWEDEATPPGAQ